METERFSKFLQESLKQKGVLYIALALMKTQPLNQDLYLNCATEQSRAAKEGKLNEGKNRQNCKIKSTEREFCRESKRNKVEEKEKRRE